MLKFPGIDALIRKCGQAMAFVGGIAIVLMMLHIVGDVAMSKLFNDPLDGTTEIVAAYYMVSVVFLPLTYVTYSAGQLVVELFTSRLRGRRLSALIGLTGLVTAAYLMFIVYFTFEEAITRTSEGEAWETSVDLVAVWPSRWMLPIGLGAMMVCVLYQAVVRLRDRAHPPDSGAGER